jgi:hypothetical protein
MDSERAWKWAERAGPVVIAPLCSLAALYFAAATYYGWDKQAAPPPVIKDDHGWSTMTLTPWIGLALLCIAIVSVLTSWGMIFIRRRAEKQKAAGVKTVVGYPEGRSESLYAPIIDMEIDASKLNQAAPWLVFSCFGYNATGYALQLAEVSGRIKIGAEEFHAKIEFDRNPFMHPSDIFYGFSLRVPLTKPEAEVCIRAFAETPVYIEFIGASIKGVAASQPANSIFRIKIPKQLKFDGDPRVARLHTASLNP